MKEIAIIGGGVAGLTLGVALRRRGIPVTLYETGTYPRHRVCGEFLNGLTSDLARILGISELLTLGVENRSVAWYLGETPFATVRLAQPAMGLSRYTMDAWLLRRFQSLGGEWRHGNASPGEKAEGWVYSTGRCPDKASTWVGLKCHVTSFPMEADLEMHLGARAYIGMSRVEDGFVNVCGLFDTAARPLRGKRGDLLLDQLDQHGLTALRTRLEDAEWRPGSFKSVANIHLGKQQAPSGKIQLGDQRTVICPFTGNGMTMAMESAAWSAPILSRYAEGRAGWEPTLRAVDGCLERGHRGRVRRSLWLQPFLFSSHRRHQLLVRLMKARVLPFQLLWRSLR